ncbi:MAG TPA: guanylate kinase [Myxococcales bacterium]|nr:guanylate kinase [Myxococcales bacterium]
MASPLLLILSAPSGAGKTTLARYLLAAEPDARLSVSTTTRAPRGQEVEGRDYHFVGEAEFQRMVEGGEFLEWARVHGFRYGTSRMVVERALREAASLTIFDIDVQGGSAIKSQFPQAVTVFILPPSLAELEARLRGRGTDSEEVIQLRLEAARSEILRGLAEYDYLVVNRVLEEAGADLSAIVRAARCRATYMRDELREAFGASRSSPAPRG